MSYLICQKFMTGAYIIKFKFVLTTYSLSVLIWSYSAPYFPAFGLIRRDTLGFLHTRTNLSPFTKDIRVEGQLDECIGDFSRVLLRRDCERFIFDYRT